MASCQGLDIAIVGGGIAGALTARVLREAHRVTIYERANDAGEVGAAIALGPTAVKILESIGFDQERAGSIPAGLIKLYDHKGNPGHEKHMDTLKSYGAEHLAYHRSDLRNELLRLAVAESGELGIQGCPARIAWGCKVTAVDAEAGKLTLSTGEEVTADLIVGEWNRKSSSRPSVLNKCSRRWNQVCGSARCRG